MARELQESAICWNLLYSWAVRDCMREGTSATRSYGLMHRSQAASPARTVSRVAAPAPVAPCAEPGLDQDNALLSLTIRGTPWSIRAPSVEGSAWL
eukprot:767813-Hanusia_phi.AAC.1